MAQFDDSGDEAVGQDTVLAPSPQNQFDFLGGMPNTDIDKLVSSGRIGSDTAQDFAAKAAIDPDIARKRELYNQLIGSQFSQIPNRGGDLTLPDQNLFFGPNGEEPVSIDSNAALQANQTLEQEKEAKAQEEQAKEAMLAQENVARASLGASQLPTKAVQVEEAAKQDEATRLAAGIGAQKAQEDAAKRQVAQKLGEQKLVDQSVAKHDDAAKTLVQNNKSKWGPAIGRAIAIMLGAYSQGLTGSKTNPAIDAIDKMVEREAEEKKYNEAQKAALQKQLVEQAKFQLEILKQKSDSRLANARIEQIQAKLAKDSEGIKQVQELHEKVKSGGGFNEDELAELTLTNPKLANQMVPVRQGVYMPSSTRDTKALKASLETFENAKRDAIELRELSKKFGNNVFAKLANREDIGQSKALLQGLVGALRLPYFGPGVLTDTEQKIAKEMIGDGADIFSIASANKARINTIIKKLNYARKTALRVNGVKIPMGQNDKLVAAYLSKGTKLSKAQIIDELVAQGRWNEDED